MVNCKEVIMAICIIMIVIDFGIGCSSDVKPSEEIMKSIIMNIELSEIRYINLPKTTFEKIKITNEFFSKNKGGGGESTPYNIELNYVLRYTISTFNVEKYRLNYLQKDKERFEQYLSDVTNKKILGDKDLIDSYKKRLRQVIEEIDYIDKQPEINDEVKDIVKDNVRYSFMKKGNKWYGVKGWR